MFLGPDFKFIYDLVPEVNRKTFSRKSESQERSVVEIERPHFDKVSVQSLSYQNQKIEAFFVSQGYLESRDLKSTRV